jgi:hypothetical protein
MSQPTPPYEPGEQQPQQGYQQGYYASPQAYPQYEGQPQPHPPAAGYGQQSHPAQPQYPPQPDYAQSPGYSQPRQYPQQQAYAPQPDSGQTQAMPQMGYPSQPYFPQQPVPPARSRKGLIIGLVGGAVALVLLVCGGVSYFVIRSIPNKPATPLAQTSTPPSRSPSKAPTQTTPARTAEAAARTPPPAPQIYSNTLEAGRFRLQVEINPAKTGNNLVHLHAFTPTGQPQKVEEWKVTASLPAAGIDQVNMPVLKITDNHAIGAISLPTPGQWQFQFTLRTSEIDQDSVTAQVPIK